MRPPASASSTVPSPIPVTAPQVAAPPPAAPVAPAVATEQNVVTPNAASNDPIKAAQSKQRSGGVRLNTPIDLSVLQGEKVLGTTAAGPIIAAAGTYQLDLVNTALGVKLRQSVAAVGERVDRRPGARRNTAGQPERARRRA